jgi:hypothetical protein
MGKLGLNVQPSTLAHQALVASGAALASSVCVIQPWRPWVGRRFGDRFFGDRFFGDRFDDGRVFFFMAIQVSLLLETSSRCPYSSGASPVRVSHVPPPVVFTN